MSTPTEKRYIDVETLAAVIACSQIIVSRPRARRRLPAGFDETDVAVLEWIAAEGRRAGRVWLPL